MTEYRMPSNLSEFQARLYRHLIDWKREHITEESGEHAGRVYDAILPESLQDQLPHLYEPVRQRFFEHQRAFPFKTHKFAGHMASSQIACANLFIPIMADPETAPAVLSAVKPDLVSIATDQLDNGFRIEFWDEPDNMLGDHNRSTGTDADFAIAYRDKAGDLNLWLIEHKLTEAEFTTCGAARSKGRIPGKHRCDITADILDNPDLCYYHSACHYNYWNITQGNEHTFPQQNLLKHKTCPFKGGLNQLWRNTLLALAIENSPTWPYQHVTFSVCHHPANHALQASMDAFTNLLGDKTRFFSFTPESLIAHARRSRRPMLAAWAEWYGELYSV